MNTMQKREELVKPLAHQVNPSSQMLGVSPSTVWKLIREEKVRAIRIGGRTLLPVTEIERLLSEGTR